MQNQNFIEEQLLLREALYPPSIVITCSLNEALIQEGLNKEMVKSVVQFVVGAGAEYGLGGLTLPAAGAGLAVGPTAETAVDSLFAAESVKSTVDAVANIHGRFGEFADLFKNARDAYANMSGDLNAFYKKLKVIVRNALKLVGQKVRGKVDELAEKLKTILTDVLNSLTGAIKSGIKLIIPDAATGTFIAETLVKLLTAGAKRPFSMAAKAIGKVSFLKEWIADPSKAVAFFKDIFTQLISLVRDLGEKLKNMSWTKSLMMGGPTVGPAIKALGPIGIKKMAGVFEKYLPTLMSVLDKVLTVVIPVTLTALALFQMLVTGDYKGKEAGGEEAAAAAAEAGAALEESEIISESIKTRWRVIAGIKGASG